jgi:hypothetical protein
MDVLVKIAQDFVNARTSGRNDPLHLTMKSEKNFTGNVLQRVKHNIDYVFTLNKS